MRTGTRLGDTGVHHDGACGGDILRVGDLGRDTAVACLGGDVLRVGDLGRDTVAACLGGDVLRVGDFGRDEACFWAATRLLYSLYTSSYAVSYVYFLYMASLCNSGRRV